MIVRLDHIGVVANSWEEAQEVLLHQMGFTLNEVRTRMPEGNYFAPENAKIYFIDVGSGETQLEILLPQDRVSGMGKFLAKRGPGLHHLGYAVDDVEAESRRLSEAGLQQIPIDGLKSASFFYPRSAMGILTELVPVRTLTRVHSTV